MGCEQRDTISDRVDQARLSKKVVFGQSPEERERRSPAEGGPGRSLLAFTRNSEEARVAGGIEREERDGDKTREVVEAQAMQSWYNSFSQRLWSEVIGIMF